jgi:hypothetical protein
MAQVSLGQAAKLTELGKTTLARAIKRGALSASRRDDGGYQIEVSELERVYPLRSPTDATVETSNETSPVAHAATVDVDLVTEVAALRATVALMREQNHDLIHERDRLLALAERLALALPKPVAETHETPLATPPAAIEMPATSSPGLGAAPAETSAAAPVTRPAMTRKQKLVQFWFGREYRRRAA